MIAVGSIVRYLDGLFRVVEVRGDRLVLERQEGGGVSWLASVSSVSEVSPQRPRSIYEGGAA